MKTATQNRWFEISNGSWVIKCCQMSDGFTGALYVGGGEIATPTTWNGKSERGLRNWAAKVLARKGA